jgi:alkyl sulfatase BDS1-like metallo-beta-lactamase superfamily hydrolase
MNRSRPNRRTIGYQHIANRRSIDAGGGSVGDRQDASEFTRAVNDELLSLLPFEDRQDFEDAARGHIADINGSVVHAADGRVT